MRLFVRLLSTLLALAVAGAGVLLAIEVGWHWWRPQDAPLLVPWPSWRDRLAGIGWDSFAIRLTAGLIAAAGLIALLMSAAARRRDVRLTDPADGVSVTTSPRSLARMVGQRVRAQENVSGASVTATAKKVRVRVISKLETENELRPRLIETVGELLGEVPLARKPKVSVVVDSPKDRQ
ncbi:DUF6286 domain-containing protein [Amycolatopsis nigrescens]|uniref:DUF6286 domain-containing protein n=1 Tax=Amycolatopsis nigrescens TaxID=381445 RepID=UPI0003639443|nr:DUF6286 domain-containing protein [Amycolatopsis nigrescens]